MIISEYYHHDHMIRLSRTTKLVNNIRVVSTLGYSNYMSSLGDEIKNKTTEISQKQLQSIVETGVKQAIGALDIIQKQLTEMNTDSVTTSVTFNAGILQITFSSTGTKQVNGKQ